MTFEINGSSGIYDGKVKDDSARYGKNAVANHKSLVTKTINSSLTGEAPILDFMPTEQAMSNNIEKLENYADNNDKIISSLPPVTYQYRYMPPVKDGNIDKKALYSAAYEEMGDKTIPVEKFNQMFMPGADYSAAPLDLNKDGNIDIPEYSTSMLAADMLSKNNPTLNSIDGSMNSRGMDAVMEYSKISNAEAATKLYSKIHSTYKLNELA